MQWRYTPHRRWRIVIGALLCGAFLVIAPATWRYLFPPARVRRAASLAGPDALLPSRRVRRARGGRCQRGRRLAAAPARTCRPTFLTTRPALVVCIALFWAGGWGLGRDIDFEQRLDLERERARAALESAEHARLLAVAHHLDPHFLFNTLNAIAEWCREDGAVAEAAILRLSALLRSIMDGISSSEPRRPHLEPRPRGRPGARAVGAAPAARRGSLHHAPSSCPEALAALPRPLAPAPRAGGERGEARAGGGPSRRAHLAHRARRRATRTGTQTRAASSSSSRTRAAYRGPSRRADAAIDLTRATRAAALRRDGANALPRAGRSTRSRDPRDPRAARRPHRRASSSACRLRVLVCDDEAMARKRAHRLLAAHPGRHRRRRLQQRRAEVRAALACATTSTSSCSTSRCPTRPAAPSSRRHPRRSRAPSSSSPPPTPQHAVTAFDAFALGRRRLRAQADRGGAPRQGHRPGARVDRARAARPAAARGDPRRPHRARHPPGRGPPRAGDRSAPAPSMGSSPRSTPRGARCSPI